MCHMCVQAFACQAVQCAWAGGQHHYVKSQRRFGLRYVYVSPALVGSQHKSFSGRVEGGTNERVLDGAALDAA